MSNKHDKDHLWERGWEGHAEAQRRRVAEWPMSVKLQWLEDAQRLAQQFRRARGEEPKKPAKDE
jgi:hypothetical protein